MVIAFRDHIVNHFTSLASLCLPFFTYIMSSILLVTLTISFLHITCIYKLQRNDIMYIHVGQPPNRSLPSKKASAMGSWKLVVYRRSSFPNRDPVLDRGQAIAFFEFSNKIRRVVVADLAHNVSQRNIGMLQQFLHLLHPQRVDIAHQRMACAVLEDARDIGRRERELLRDAFQREAAVPVMLGDIAAELVGEAGTLGLHLFKVVVSSQCKRFSFVAAVLSLIVERSPARVYLQ